MKWEINLTKPNEIMINDDLKIDKQTETCAYNDELHMYWDKVTKGKFISCTTLIHSYTQSFDGEFWAAYKTFEALLLSDHFAILKKTLLATRKFNPVMIKKVGLDEEEFYNKKAEILKGYEDGKNEACERGTKIHANFESSFYNGDLSQVKRFGLGGNFECKKDYYSLDLDRGIYPEYLIGVTSSDGVLKVAGQIDCLIKDNNDIYIIDWKSNKEIRQKSFYDRSKKSSVRMKAPLSHLDDCNWNHYQMQLSLYAYLLQTVNPEFSIKGLKLVHIDHSDKITEYEVTYLKDEVIAMLKHYKKQLKIKQELDKNKPIVY